MCSSASSLVGLSMRRPIRQYSGWSGARHTDECSEITTVEGPLTISKPRAAKACRGCLLTSCPRSGSPTYNRNTVGDLYGCSVCLRFEIHTIYMTLVMKHKPTCAFLDSHKPSICSVL